MSVPCWLLPDESVTGPQGSLKLQRPRRPVAAGIARFHPRTFILMDGTAALITVPALYFLAYYFGEQLDVLRGFLGSTKKAAALLLGAVLILWLAKRRVMRWWRERGTPAA